MDQSRRSLFLQGASAVGAGVLATSALGAEKAPAKAAKAQEMIAACGLACKTCPLLKAGKCKGCASGTGASPAMLKMKPCPVLQCAAKKKIEYCGRDCKGFTKCKKMIGRPYDKMFMAMIKKRLEAEK